MTVAEPDAQAQGRLCSMGPIRHERLVREVCQCQCLVRLNIELLGNYTNVRIPNVHSQDVEVESANTSLVRGARGAT